MLPRSLCYIYVCNSSIYVSSFIKTFYEFSSDFFKLKKKFSRMDIQILREVSKCFNLWFMDFLECPVLIMDHKIISYPII